MRIPGLLLTCITLALAGATHPSDAVCRARTVTTAGAQSPPPTGAWTINANGAEGELIITRITNGNVRGTMFGNEMRGMYDDKTKSLSVLRLNGDGFAFQSYKGYLFPNREVKRVMYNLAGTFQVYSGEGGVPGEYGWYARFCEENK